MTAKLQNEKNQAKLTSLSSHVHTSKVRNNHPSDCGHHAFEKWRSFRPSELLAKTKRHTYEKKEHPHSEKGTHCSNCKQKSRKPDKSERNASSLQTSHSQILFQTVSLSLTFLLPSFSVNTSPQRSQPVHVERKASLL